MICGFTCSGFRCWVWRRAWLALRWPFLFDIHGVFQALGGDFGERTILSGKHGPRVLCTNLAGVLLRLLSIGTDNRGILLLAALGICSPAVSCTIQQSEDQRRAKKFLDKYISGEVRRSGSGDENDSLLFSSAAN